VHYVKKKNALHHIYCICKYTPFDVYGKTHAAHQRQIHTGSVLFPFVFSRGRGGVVIGPDHGPRVDVEQETQAARAWLAPQCGWCSGPWLESEEACPECESGEQHIPQALGMADT
jgi:hypothetical protein